MKLKGKPNRSFRNEYRQEQPDEGFDPDTTPDLHGKKKPRSSAAGSCDGRGRTAMRLGPRLPSFTPQRGGNAPAPRRRSTMRRRGIEFKLLCHPSGSRIERWLKDRMHPDGARRARRVRKASPSRRGSTCAGVERSSWRSALLRTRSSPTRPKGSRSTGEVQCVGGETAKLRKTRYAAGTP